MDCPTEVALIRDRLGMLPGIEALAFDLARRRLTLKHAPEALPRALAALRSLGFEPEAVSADAADTHAHDTPAVSRSQWVRLALAGACALLAELVSLRTGETHWAVMALSIIAVFGAGLRTYARGWIAARNLDLNMNALMSIAATGAMAIGEWPEAAMVMVLFTLAETIESLSLARARNAIRALMAMAPEVATVRAPDGAWREVPAAEVAIGAIVRVRPGERIALDGVVTSGASTVDQAPITGESIPADKAAGDAVFAGTINGAGSLEFRVTAGSSQSTLARIIHAVEAAQASRAPTQRFVDRFARIYTPTVFAVALAVGIVPPLFMDGSWFEWIYRALVLLVIACPCALVISTPVTIVSGLAAAARHGILVKGGAFLEAGRKLRVLAFDKTGTLTQGHPEVTDFIPLVPGSEARLRHAGAGLASRSDHPVSRAIATMADADEPPTAIEAFTSLPGRGVRGTIAGRTVHLGNHRLAEELGACSPGIEARLAGLEAAGRTTVLLIEDGVATAVFAVADAPRASSREALDELHALGVSCVMLTGDNDRTARSIAATLRIDDVRSSLLPEEKLAAVEEFRARGGAVGMVGDGINDAPALTRADIGFAMAAAGSDTAIETADVALMDDDLRKVPLFIRLSRRTASVLAQNIALAIGIKAVFLGLTVTGQASMWMAVFADMGASLIVVFNGLRMLRGV